MVHCGRGLVPRPGLYSRDLCTRAVVKSTFVESKTRTIESESRPSPKRFESKSKRFESKSSPSPNETVKTEKEKNNLLQNHILKYNLCDTRDSISSILR